MPTRSIADASRSNRNHLHFKRSFDWHTPMTFLGRCWNIHSGILTVEIDHPAKGLLLSADLGKTSR
jgi:hypothetical protein